jgi:hypothetical protein
MKNQNDDWENQDTFWVLIWRFFISFEKNLTNLSSRKGRDSNFVRRENQVKIYNNFIIFFFVELYTVLNNNF